MRPADANETALAYRFALAQQNTPTAIVLTRQPVTDTKPDVEIPGESYGFTRLKHAQAIGDLDTLRGHGLPAERVTLTGDDPATDLRALSERLRRLL